MNDPLESVEVVRVLNNANVQAVFCFNLVTIFAMCQNQDAMERYQRATTLRRSATVRGGGATAGYSQRSATDPVTFYSNPFGSAEVFAYPQPDAANVVKEGILSKRILGKTISWGQRYVKIADGHLYMSLEPGSEIRDALDLMLVTTIQQSTNQKKLMSGDSMRSVRELSQKVLTGMRSPSIDASVEDTTLLQDGKGQENPKAEVEQGDHEDGEELQETPSGRVEAGKTAEIISNVKQRRLRSSLQAVQMVVRLKGTATRAQSAPNSPGAMEDKDPSSAHQTFHDFAWENVLEIYSKSLGRTYYLRAEDEHDCKEWIDAIFLARKKAFEDYKKSLNLTVWQKSQRQACDFYENSCTQMVIAFLLVLNFVINVIQTELQVPQ